MCRGKTPKRSRSSSNLKPQELLADTSVAGYYALILNATGNAAKATPYLEAAIKAKLLPEEQKLFRSAARGSQ